MSRRLAALVTLPACGSTTVPAEEIAAAAVAAFDEESGGIEFPVTCPEGLEAEVGSETRCVLPNTHTRPLG